MDKKYVVPEGGLKAALGQVDYARAHSGVEEGIIKRALQDFVCWITVEIEKMRVENKTTWQAGRNATIEDVLKLFLAPEPEVNFEERMNELTVEVNRVGMRKAIEILRASHDPDAGQDIHPDPIIETMNRRMAEYSDWVHTNLQNLFDKKPLEPRLDWDKPGRKVFTYGDRMKK